MAEAAARRGSSQASQLAGLSAQKSFLHKRTTSFPAKQDKAAAPGLYGEVYVRSHRAHARRRPQACGHISSTE